MVRNVMKASQLANSQRLRTLQFFPHMFDDQLSKGTVYGLFS